MATNIVTTLLLLTVILTYNVKAETTITKKVHIKNLNRYLYFKNDKHMEFSYGRAIIKKGNAINMQPKSYSALRAKKMVSPIFTDSPSGGGAKRSLPGGVIIRFKDDMDEHDITNWTTATGFSLQRHRGKPNSWIVSTGAGLTCLDVLNRLQSDPKIRSAKPNWWLKLEKK